MSERNSLGGDDKLKDACVRLVEVVLEEGCAAADWESCFLGALQFTLHFLTVGRRREPLPSLAQHPCWASTQLWQGVLVESLKVAQAEAKAEEAKSLKKRFMDVDGAEKDEQRALEERVAYGQLCWVLQQMVLFGKSYGECREFCSGLAAKLGDVVTPSNMVKVTQYIAVCEEEAVRSPPEEEVDDQIDELEAEEEDGVDRDEQRVGRGVPDDFGAELGMDYEAPSPSAAQFGGFDSAAVAAAVESPTGETEGLENTDEDGVVVRASFQVRSLTVLFPSLFVRPPLPPSQNTHPCPILAATIWEGGGCG
eukprot:SAG11_NODE_3433_length_2450_cov_1.809017_2_plen_309_part_00